MPMYRKKYNKKTKKYYYKKKRNIWYNRTSNKALRLARYAVRNLNVEYKFFDTGSTSALSSTAATILNLAPIPRGDSSSDRDGRSIKLKSLFVKGSLQLNASATTSRVRILIVLKINNNLLAPTALDVLDTLQMNSLRNLNNTDNIKVMYDKRFVIDVNRQSEIFFQFYKKLSHRQQYEINSTAGVATVLERMGFYIIAFSDEPTNTPNMLYTSRVRFIDN